MITVILPYHLRNLAGVGSQVEVALDGPATAGAILDALEARYPALQGTIREYSGQRRAYIRFFACGQDLSHQPLDALLPDDVANGKEPFRIVGAMSGG